MSETQKVDITSTVELPPAVIDEIATKVQTDDVDSRTIRDWCFHHIERDTQFVTPNGQPVADAIKQR